MTQKDLPWIEKYCPSLFSDIIIDDYIAKRIRQMIVSKNIPNLIFDGPPGVGKTVAVRCLAKELYGKYHDNMVLELNTSDDRGIRAYDAIENFKKSFVHIDPQMTGKIFPQKLVILDEADNMTDKAKYIVLTFIENNSDELRFVLTCNIKSNILPAIQSRCHIVHFPKISYQLITNRLEHILKAEKVEYQNTNGLEMIAQLADGDMRIAINMMQLTYVRFNLITPENVYEIYDKPRPTYSLDIIYACNKKDLPSALQHLIVMRQHGYSGMDIAQGLLLVLKLPLCKIQENTKINFFKIISHALYNISKGINSLLQISACIAEMCL